LTASSAPSPRKRLLELPCMSNGKIF
jgi:hypothetical protein